METGLLASHKGENYQSLYLTIPSTKLPIKMYILIYNICVIFVLSNCIYLTLQEYFTIFQWSLFISDSSQDYLRRKVVRVRNESHIARALCASLKGKRRIRPGLWSLRCSQKDPCSCRVDVGVTLVPSAGQQGCRMMT